MLELQITVGSAFPLQVVKTREDILHEKCGKFIPQVFKKAQFFVYSFLYFLPPPFSILCNGERQTGWARGLEEEKEKAGKGKVNQFLFIYSFKNI